MPVVPIGSRTTFGVKNFWLEPQTKFHDFILVVADEGQVAVGTCSHQHSVAADRIVVERFVQATAVGRPDRPQAAAKPDPGVGTDVRADSDADPADRPVGVVTDHHESDAMKPAQLPENAREIGEFRSVSDTHRRR